jgi:hypothetical protein
LERELTFISPWVEDEPDKINPSLTQERIDALDQTWQAYLLALEKYVEELSGDVNANEAYRAVKESVKATTGLPPKQPKRLSVDRYEYVYGFREIGARCNEYEDVGVYVTPSIPTQSNVMMLALETVERHPAIYQGSSVLTRPDSGYPLRRTSVEWSIAPVADPGPGDWIPILPLEGSVILNEVLFFSNQLAELRFSADLTARAFVYKNEEPISAWRLMDAKRIRLDEPVESSAIYTIDYVPLRTATLDPHNIDFTQIATPVWRPYEEFDGADRNCMVKLNHSPWVDRARINDVGYNPVEVTLNPIDSPLRDTDKHRLIVSGQGVTYPIPSTRNPDAAGPRLFNITRYRDGAEPILSPYDPDPPDPLVPTFEYYHVGNKLVFTEDFRSEGSERNYGYSHGNAVIRVRYQTLVTEVRVRAILRRTWNDASLTPIIDHYVLKARAV